MTDRLTLARALEEGGIARNAAEHIATEIFDAIHNNTATKADLKTVEAELSSRIDGVEAALSSRIDGVEAALSSRIDGIRAELLLRISELEHRMTLRFGSIMVVVTGIILAAIRYLPHS